MTKISSKLLQTDFKVDDDDNRRRLKKLNKKEHWTQCHIYDQYKINFTSVNICIVMIFLPPCDDLFIPH